MMTATKGDGLYMAIQNPPTANTGVVEFMTHYRRPGSSTVVWVQEMDNGRPGRVLQLLRWGNKTYLPVEEGVQIGVVVHNGSTQFRAYPAFVEALNIWDSGPNDPNDCFPSHMWEVSPGRQLIMDKLVSQNQTGRPLQIVRSGSGFGIGESTFHTDEFAGQFRIYERTVLGIGVAAYRYRLHPDPMPTVFREDTKGNIGGCDIPRSPSFTPGSFGPAAHKEGRAAIGAGEEVSASHYETGRRYRRDAQPVISLQFEMRQDLAAMLARACANPYSWYYQGATGYNWWQVVENMLASSGFVHATAPQVPVAPQPHRPNPYQI